ncbi:MAG: DUF2029 domain-containing protein [Flavobacteriaceae bacterium]|nr:MAG: DUF2029 domain-containing protein [Flavobacteriaceae bacterium]
MQFWKLHKVPILVSIISIVLYLYFGYALERTQHSYLLLSYFSLFLLFLILLSKTELSFKTYAFIAFGFRAIFIFSIPNLSQDFYRFIWDGRLILEGINPYLFSPDNFMLNGKFPIAQAQELFEGMGALSSGHYSNYPPINQLCFIIAGLFSGKSILGSVITLRLLIIAADFGIMHYGMKLLKTLRLPVKSIFLYLLNPFIIIELTGNLHFEGVMLFFMVWSLYLLHKSRWQLAAVVFAFSVSVKLIPLIFLPLLFQKLGWKKSIGFYAIVGLITLILFLPFYTDQFIINYTETVGLWFQNFEFNASLYYFMRTLGYMFRGWNEIAIIGKIIPALVVLVIILLSVFRTNRSTIQLVSAMLLGLTFYYFTATTVHPWYIATLLLLSVFTNYKFPLVWTAVIILSYLAYGEKGFNESLYVIVIEYLLVYGVFIWEVLLKRSIPFLFAHEQMHSIEET